MAKIGGEWHFTAPLTSEQQQYVRALGLSEEALLRKGETGNPPDRELHRKRLGGVGTVRYLPVTTAKNRRLNINEHSRRLPHALHRLLPVGRNTCTVIIVGPSGTGKTFLSCALAHQAIRKGHTALYFRAPGLFQALMMARADGS